MINTGGAEGRSRAVQLARPAAFVAAGSGVGAACGVLWWRVVDLAAYSVADNGGATTNERGLAEFFAGDAWFCLIGAAVGLLLGLAGWRLFRRDGWVAAAVVVVAALGAALLCWAVGYALGPGDFTSRLAHARPGETVPIELTIRAKASLVVWPFLALVPVLLGASLGRDEEEPRPIFRRRSSRSRSATGAGTDGGANRSGQGG